MKNLDKFIVYNSWIAKLIIPNFKYIMLFGFVLTKSDKENFKENDKVHEGIHCLQYWDCFLFIGLPIFILALTSLILCNIISWKLSLTILIPFTIYYIWYGLNWFYQLITIGFNHEAYRNIIFERQAYSIEDLFKSTGNINEINYKHFSWIKY